MVMTHPFYSRESLQVETYDALNAEIPGGDDVAFARLSDAIAAFRVACSNSSAAASAAPSVR